MPTRFDDDLRIKLPNGVLFITGSTDFKSENVIAYEAGYRVRPVEWLSLDAALFTNRYDDLRSQEPPLTAGAPVVLANGLRATTSGTEISATASLTKWWQMHGSYSYLTEAFSRAPDSRDATNGVSEANDPSHVWSLRTSMDARRVQFDAQLRHSSPLPSPTVKAYTELNARLGWALTPRWDLSLIGQNLLHDRHEEFAAGTPRELFERGISIRTALKF
jgi:iron complex outermembrane receptor protein